MNLAARPVGDPHAGRETVLHFCQAISTRDFASMRDLVTDDMTWFVPGLKHRADYAGLFSFDQMLPTLAGFLSRLETFEFRVVSSTAEADRVAVEATSHGVLNGVSYDNVYIMLYRLRDGRISSLREFLDQTSVAEFGDRLAGCSQEPDMNARE